MATVQQQQSLFPFWKSPCVYLLWLHSLHCIGLSKNAQLLIAAFIKVSLSILALGHMNSMSTHHQAESLVVGAHVVRCAGGKTVTGPTQPRLWRDTSTRQRWTVLVLLPGSCR